MPNRTTFFNLSSSISFRRFPMSRHLSFKLCFSVITLVYASCKDQPNQISSAVARKFEKADSLVIAGQFQDAQQVLRDIRRRLEENDPALAHYYTMQANLAFPDASKMAVYADSVMAFFENNERRQQLPDDYREALLVKGDVCLKEKKYVAALGYYAKAQTIRPIKTCDDGDVAEKIGGIYFEQGSYETAAKFFAEKCRKQSACNAGLSKEKQFVSEQACLNNAGYAFERANLLDSATWYYQRDTIVINRAEKEQAASRRNINAARATVYDNLGGLALKLGKLKEARQLLLTSTALNFDGADRGKATAYIKLASVYLQLDSLKQTAETIERAKRLLNTYLNARPEYKLRLEKVYADYLFASGRPQEAFKAEYHYVLAKDSLANTLTSLYRMDVSREIAAMQRQNELTELQQKEKSRVYLITGTLIIVGLLLTIMILVTRNLKRAQVARKDLANANSGLTKANQNYVRMLRVMAHDLRNPLGGISGLAELMLEDDHHNEDDRRTLSLIESTSKHSLAMINELLTAGLGETATLKKVPTDVNRLLVDVVELLQFKAAEKKQTITYSGQPRPVIIPLNYEKVWRVFNNLIVNALKFSHEHSDIEVSLSTTDSHVLIAVADRGIGIPEGDSEKVFEIFTSAKREGTKGEQAFGLGLSISKNIVEMHQGRLWFENRPGGGTIFYIQFPAVV